MFCSCLASHYAFKPTRYLQDKHYKLLHRILLKIQLVNKMSSTAALLHFCWVRDYWLLLDTCNTHNKTLIWCNISIVSTRFFASTQRRPLHGLRWVYLSIKKPILSSFHDQFRTANPVPSAVCSSSSVGSKGIYTSCRQTTMDTSFQEVSTAANHPGFKSNGLARLALNLSFLRSLTLLVGSKHSITHTMKPSCM